VGGVTFSLAPGDCLALFGPNGAGKTTLLRVLAGLLKPTSGIARVSGIPLPGGPLARSRIGLISHHTMLYEALSPRENVAFSARLYGIRDARERVEDSLRGMSMPLAFILFQTSSRIAGLTTKSGEATPFVPLRNNA